MKRILLPLAWMVLMMIGFTSSKAQILSGAISLSPKDTTICPNQTFTIYGGFSYGATDVNADDQFGDSLINIGFPFVYYGVPYTKCIYGPNAFLSFDTTLAGTGFNSWVYPTALASGNLNNAILLPFQDLVLSQAGPGTVTCQTQGQIPYRRFILEICKVPQFSCAFPVTSQVILYETTNIIEIHIGNQPSCPGWNGGTQIEGIRGLNGTSQNLAPGRDLPNVPWTAVNDGRRWTPITPTVYKMDSIPYAPGIIIPHADSNNIKWFEPNNPIPIAVGPHVTVTPTANIGYYYAQVSGQNGCLGSQTYTFQDTTYIHYGSSYDTTHVEICAGTTYSWFGHDLFASGNYDTLLHSQMGCDSFLRLNLLVNPLPDVTVKGNTNVGICSTDSVTLSILGAESNVTYQWFKDDVAITGATAFRYTTHQAGTYKLVATTNKGCQRTSQTFKVVVNPNPVAKIQPIASDIPCSYDTVQLVATAGPNYDYRWSPEKPFRAITGADVQKPKGVFIDLKTDVVLTVFNEFGCYDNDTVQVLTKPCCEVFTPSAFTPNGDGLNDFFYPELKNGQILLNLEVYDRYGKRVYNNENIKEGWNGAYKDGSAAASGVYMYFMKYTCSDGKLYEKKESVTLLR